MADEMRVNSARRRRAVAFTFGVVVVLIVTFTVTFVLLNKTHEPHRRTDVVSIHFEPIPEGISIQDQHRGDPAWLALPDELPKPSPQPPECKTGALITLTLASGARLDYGPCQRPASIDPVACRMLYPDNEPVSCADH